MILMKNSEMTGVLKIYFQNPVAGFGYKSQKYS